MKPAVLMMHGLECDMNFFTINDPDKTPAYVLVEQGYDVWLSNNRGTRYGQGHMTLDPESEEFWDFNFEQNGMNDLPAYIDFVLEMTGQSQLTYVGHSNGTTQLFMAGSLNPDYFSEKINLFVALAPVAKISHSTAFGFMKAENYWREL